MEDEIYYQPVRYYDDGTSIDYGGFPEELASFQVFPSIETCKSWLDNNGYDADDFAIIRYKNDDIEDHVYLDACGEKADRYTVSVAFTTTINVQVWAGDKVGAKDEAEHKAAKIFEEQLNEGLLGTSDFTVEAQEF